MRKDIALITGSSRGIGFAIAKEFDDLNKQIILTGRSIRDLEASLKYLKQNAHFLFQINFLNNNEIDKFINELIEKDLIPNILIHNVGGVIEGDKFPLDLEILKLSLHINLEVAIKINEKILPYMVKNKFGRIIHISSDASLTGKAAPAYVIAKSALNGYVKSVSRVYAKDNIMICAVLPGIIEHEGSAWENKKFSQPEYYKKKLEQMPLGRFGNPQEIAKFVADLANGENMMSAGALFELKGAV